MIKTILKVQTLHTSFFFLYISYILCIYYIREKLWVAIKEIIIIIWKTLKKPDVFNVLTFHYTNNHFK